MARETITELRETPTEVLYCDFCGFPQDELVPMLTNPVIQLKERRADGVHEIIIKEWQVGTFGRAFHLDMEGMLKRQSELKGEQSEFYVTAYAETVGEVCPTCSKHLMGNE